MIRIIPILILLSGCTPYVGYTHLSQPNVNDDGYDLMCGGVEYRKRHVRIDGAVCENLANSHTDTYGKIDVRVLIY